MGGPPRSRQIVGKVKHGEPKSSFDFKAVNEELTKSALKLDAAANAHATSEVDRGQVRKIAEGIRARRDELVAKDQLTGDEVQELAKLDRAIRGDIDDDLRRHILAMKRKDDGRKDGRRPGGTVKDGVFYEHPDSWSDKKVRRAIKRAKAAKRRVKVRS